MCCCFNLHRHQIHLISYGCVSFLLIATGLVFTVFAIFQKDSQIGKVWLAGPTTMVVGLVLCGKVIIDWGPAMLHAREGSIDTRLVDQMNNPIARFSDAYHPVVQPQFAQHEPKCNGNAMPLNGGSIAHQTSALGLHGSQLTVSSLNYPPHRLPRPSLPASFGRSGVPLTLPRASGVGEMQQNHHLHHHHHHQQNHHNRTPPDASSGVSAYDAHSCLVYSQYDPPLNNFNDFQCVRSGATNNNSARNSIRSAIVRASPRASQNNSNSSPAHSSVDTCECSQYGSIRHMPVYQGESFVLNERNYLI